LPLRWALPFCLILIDTSLPHNMTDVQLAHNLLGAPPPCRHIKGALLT